MSTIGISLQDEVEDVRRNEQKTISIMNEEETLNQNKVNKNLRLLHPLPN